MDPLSSNPPSLESLTQRKSTRLSHSARNSTRQIIEVYASTRPYPSWWSEIDESKILRRRKSIGETVLERNICFIDTPGYSYAMSKIEGIEAVVQYIETQMAKTLSATSLSDGDLLNLLGGDGGVQVDVVFYLISQSRFDRLWQHLFDVLICDCRDKTSRPRIPKTSFSPYQFHPTHS